nr:protein inscuteable homolog [Cherax quadricarinatus]
MVEDCVTSRSSKMTQSEQEVPRQHFFQREGSRVYYASETGCWPANSLPRTFWTRHRSTRESVILEAKEDGSSSGEEALEGDASPGGSFRESLRGFPSHRSQDSGYSDSGESTNAQNDSDSLPTTPPNVKHITRVYFGENPCLYNDKIVCVPSVNINTVASASVVDDATHSKTSPCRNYRHDRTANFEELAEELEYKSVLDAANRRTGAVRKRVSATTASVAQGRLQRRSSSAESLLADEQVDHDRRLIAARTRRRWSVSDMQYQHTRISRQQNVAPSHVSCGTSTHVTCGTNTQVSCNSGGRRADTKLMRGATDLLSLECLDGPVNSSRLARETDIETVFTFPSSRSFMQSRIHPVTLSQEMRNPSLQQWLKELRVLYESECMNTLQSKSIPGDSGDLHYSHLSTKTKISSNNTVEAASSSASHAVRTIQRRAHAISTEFSRLCQRLEWLELGQVPLLAGSLVTHINTFLRDYTTQWTSADPDLLPQSSLGRQSKVIQQVCERLQVVCSNDHHDHDTTRQVVQVVTALGHAFTKLVDLMLSREIRMVVRALEESRSISEVLAVVSQLSALGVDGGHICRLIARLGGVRGLLAVCLEPRLRLCRVDALRALATICCVVDGIVELEKAGGVEVVAEVLCDEDCPEEERSEAAGVLAQITSPWVENTHRLPAIHTHMCTIVQALTDLAEFTQTPEVFLLASAALANLSFLDDTCVSAIRAAGTVGILLKAQRDNPSISIFTKDQIATILANLAGSREAAEEVVRGGGVAVLLALLNTGPAPSLRLPEVAAAERIQQKSAITLSRLCRDPSVAQQVLELGGAERLVKLCKDDQERHHSDAVLIACLAALRKMASSLGSEELRGMDAAELVEPRLLDSFLTYSSRQESFV